MNKEVFYYSFNNNEKSFVGKFPATQNPKRLTEYLLPAKATFKEPPVTNENEIAIWTETDWIIKPDFRGQLQVNIDTKEVTVIDYIGAIKNNFQIITNEIADDIKTTPEKYKKIKNTLEDISETEEYKKYLIEKEKAIRKKQIENAIYSLDTKRIRAICEPEIKNTKTGETWLDYYNAQILELRNELKNL